MVIAPWPVTLCMYNLPSWLCVKRKFIMMPVLIPGPKQPRNDIDVYLRPLVEELLLLWGNESVRMWDMRGYEGRLTGKGTLGKKSYVCTDDFSFKKSCITWITREHMNTFCSWLRKHLMHKMDISEQLFLLARGPSWNILTYQGYEINVNTFYTIAQD